MSIFFWTGIGVFTAVVLLAGLITTVTSVTKEAGVDWAPGWRVRCTKCHRSKLGRELGMIRLGARGTKYTLGFCTHCDRMRWVAIERVADDHSPA